ncbi:MAG: hypothetical protein K0Q73_5638 [Paenibacillus sp.]|jgi:hypothetical protein|nr:hypothetical protein [Paenibacillus sp.]
MIYFVGDLVVLKSGMNAEILESWGIAREWFKMRTVDGKVIFVTASQIDALIKRKGKNNGRRHSK